MSYRLAHILAACSLLLPGLLPQPAAAVTLDDQQHVQVDTPVHAPESALVTPARTHAGAQLTSEDLAAFLDGLLPTSMAIGDIAGAVVVVVQDGRVLLARPYGFADVDERIAVSAERTLFRVASITKLFTWTAVMQQVEAGALDLDRDINEYLDFNISGYGGQPITLRHLMTHTPGFEERIKGCYESGEVKPLRALLVESIPARIFPPGKIPAYSNYGAALAAYIVQRVSGVPFDDYVEQRIFQPLRMRYSTLKQPVPPQLSAQLSKDYERASQEPLPFEFVQDAPAGSLSVSGMDIAQFMLAHLHDGIVPDLGESSRILKPATVELMHSVANRPAPHIDAMALGFYEQNRNGVRVIAHGGDIKAFHSDLLLIPSAKVGIFMSFNSLGKDRATYQLRDALYQGFMDRYFPRVAAPEHNAPARGAEDQPRAVEGPYQLSRREERNLFSFIYMLGQTSASVTTDGILTLDALTGLNGEPKKFKHVGPWLWREENGETRLSAVPAANGTIEYLAADGYGPVFVFQPVAAAKDKRWLVPAMVVAAVILTAAVFSWLIGAVRRRLRRAREAEALSSASQRIRLASRIASLSGFVFLALLGVFVVLSSGTSDWIFQSDAIAFLRIMQLSALFAVIGSVVAVIAAAQCWRTPEERGVRAAGRSLIAVACAVCAYVAVAFHFLSMRLVY